MFSHVELNREITIMLNDSHSGRYIDSAEHITWKFLISIEFLADSKCSMNEMSEF